MQRFSVRPALKIIEYANLVTTETVEEKRSWRERLFSLPWQPFRKTNTVVKSLPSKEAIQLESGFVIMHPVMAEEFRRKSQEFS